MTHTHTLAALLHREDRLYQAKREGMTFEQRLMSIGSDTSPSLSQSIVYELTPEQVGTYGYLIEDMDDTHHAVFISKLKQHRDAEEVEVKTVLA